MTRAAHETAPALRIWTPAQSAVVVSGVLLLLSELLVPSAAGPFPGHGERFAAMVSYAEVLLKAMRALRHAMTATSRTMTPV